MVVGLAPELGTAVVGSRHPEPLLMVQPRQSRGSSRKLVAVLLALHGLLLGWSALRHTPTDAEPAHLAAGVSHLTLGRFDLFRVNPPLVRTVAVLPVLLARPSVDWKQYATDPMARCESVVGVDFLRANGPRSVWLTALARWACVPFSLVGGGVCFLWARRLYGETSAIIAATLWCCSPNVLGHASLIAPDAHAAALGVAASYCFWRWLERPAWRRAVVAGFALGTAQLAKTTLVLLYPLWLVTWILYRARRLPGKPFSSSFAEAGMILTLLLLSVYLLNAGYAFEGSFQRLDAYSFQSTALGGPTARDAASNHGANRFAGTWLGSLPVPLPRNYLQGIDAQRYDFERGLPSYLRGQWAEHGWWCYYLYALAVKVPLGTWCLVGLALGVTIFAPSYSAEWRDEMVVLAPGLAILVFVSSQTGFSIHSRYVIPALPFFFVWASKVGRVFVIRPFTRKRRALATAVVAALAWSVTSSLWAYPHSLSYFNELVGGPKHGGEHLLDSNIDWGQDLFYLRDWLDEQSEVRLDGLAYSGSYPVTLAGIPERPRPPRGPEITHGDPHAAESDFCPEPGCYALSVNYLYARSRQFRYFLQFEPVASAGYSIYIYHVTPEEAGRVRRELGLPEILETKAEATGAAA